MSLNSLSPSSILLIKKFNICLERYNYYISQNSIKSEVLNYVIEFINDDDKSIILLNSIMERLLKFSTTYDVDIEDIDDFKLVYFIAYYFLEDDDFCSNHTDNKHILEVLHLIMCKTLLVYEPESILNKVKFFIQNNNYEKFKEEYGDIGYYHMIKSTYLMQKNSTRLLMEDEILQSENSLVSTYFLKVTDE